MCIFLEHARILPFHLSRLIVQPIDLNHFILISIIFPMSMVAQNKKKHFDLFMFRNVLFLCVCDGEVLLKVVYRH
jgi:hypothetical protein